MPSIHPKFDTLIALAGGFFASFLTLTVVTVQRSQELQGQLIAGDPSSHSELPTTLTTIQNAMQGTDPLMMAMSTYTWWIMVLVGGLVGAFIILRFMRRYA